MNKNGILIPQPKPDADLRLFVFPYAGGQAQNFQHWTKHLEDEVELVCVQYPGRGLRSEEALCHDLSSLRDILLTDLESLINQDHKPYVFFGHSFGARLALELTHSIEARNWPAPLHLIASAGKAPHTQISNANSSTLSSDELRKKMATLGGTPAAVLEDQELFNMLSPIIRADLNANDHYFRAPHSTLSCTATIMGGKDDSAVSLEHLLAWQDHFSNKISFQLYDGNHFFINSHTEEVLLDINAILQQCLYA